MIMSQCSMHLLHVLCNIVKHRLHVCCRLCLITFTLFTIVATLAVLAAAPHVIVK